ncbi:uncharacterized protein LAESUDRAFT_712559 [Laetiporus sulphureus 93-53]|uniref:Uncharacterized protein n=1 Tax=Laetiporus sulphureus 93-53 TaxID=1314785 RepID=A0A165FH24_9APHY|nr:uncharacterized protein LAESUDRAFT_712559 [Laetiporus sulphureus 93-53]KZT08960.1 hypothetical protein LAESUDRAFT_712559 [Laetiporus sulphureus 93-53]
MAGTGKASPRAVDPVGDVNEGKIVHGGIFLIAGDVRHPELDAHTAVFHHSPVAERFRRPLESIPRRGRRGQYGPSGLQGPSAEEIRAWAARREQFLSTAFRFCAVSKHSSQDSGGAACPACVEYTEACNALLRVTHGLRNMYLGMNWVVRLPKLRPQETARRDSLVEIKGCLRGAQQDMLHLINIRKDYDEAKVRQEVVQALLDHIGEERQILYEEADI